MGESDGAALNAAISRGLVQERYDAAALTVSRIRSEDDDECVDLDLVPYYEGKRDALRELLEASNV